MSRFELADVRCKCGWKYKSFHICVDLTKPCPGEGRIVAPPVKKKTGFALSLENRVVITELSDEARAALVARNKIRWAKHHEKNRERDEKIILRYANGGIGMKKIADEFGIGYHTVISVLRRASEAGIIVIRPRGTTVAKGG